MDFFMYAYNLATQIKILHNILINLQGFFIYIPSHYPPPN